LHKGINLPSVEKNPYVAPELKTKAMLVESKTEGPSSKR